MNKYLSRLSPTERRFVVGVTVVAFVVLNFIFVWPHFGDRVRYKSRLDRARSTIERYEKEISQRPKYEGQIRALEQHEGASVPQEDQSIDFLRTIQSQAGLTGVNVLNYGRQTTVSNQFFIERSQAITTQSGEKELVGFLYNLGTGNSMIRVRGLSIRRDPSGTQLSANITLAASYQKKTPPARTGTSAAAPTASSSPTATSKK
ncbi:MAG TPA: hypothetical protein PKA41_19900 [Verrucomicrobiota bacterium]|nr:hypothetical protein [Verrucomicrobiota bacterium]